MKYKDGGYATARKSSNTLIKKTQRGDQSVTSMSIGGEEAQAAIDDE